jgi:hypothetical protein
MTAFGVAVSGGGTYYDSASTITVSNGGISLIDSDTDTGYVQLVKTVTP